MPTELVEKVHQAQHLRHVLGNKLALPMTVLRELEDGRAVEPEVIRRAIRDLDATVKLVSSAGSTPDVQPVGP